MVVNESKIIKTKTFFRMGKKKDQVAIEAENQAVLEAEKHEKMRRDAIAEFNMNNIGVYWIDPDKVPTDEDINKAKEDYETVTKNLNEKKDYVIADKTNALRVAKFLKNFVENGFWSQRGFVGVINFVTLLDEFINNFNEEDPVDLVLEFPPLQFCFIMLENYGGIGLDAALRMANMWETYVPIYEHVHELIDWHEQEANKCKELSDRWGYLSQGYYINILKDDEQNNKQ